MFTKNEQFITQTKLQELRKQRGLLLTTYNELKESVANAPTTAAKLRKLYLGLRKVRFAGRSLHPEVTNLEPILYGVDPAGGGKIEHSLDTTSYWLEKLEKALS